MTTPPIALPNFPLNDLAATRVEALVEAAPRLGLAVRHLDRGVRLIDAGIDVTGSVEAGRQIAEICLAGLGRVSLRSDPHAAASGWPSWIEVESAQPVAACLASQYAGWSLAASKEETGGKKFFALGSGPVRALAAKEALYEELGMRDCATRGTLVLEVDREPPAVVIDKVLRDTGLSPEGLTLILTPTRSLAGTTQVVARVLEVAMHKAHTLGFALGDIVEGRATAPLPAPADDGVEAMGRTNDAILFGGSVHLVVRGRAEDAEALARRLPSNTARDHGRPFAEVFRAVEFDFYKIDPALFAPAEVWVSHLGSGATWHAGAMRLDLLRAQWMPA